MAMKLFRTLVKRWSLLAKCSVYLFCFSLFFQQIFKIIKGRINGLTAIGSSTHLHKEIDLPAITICPGIAFKTQGPFFDEAAFEKNAYKLQDILSEESVLQLSNETLYKVLEVRNVLHGRCYTIYFLCKSEIIIFCAF